MAKETGKRRGRPKGAHNRKTVAKRLMAARVAAEGVTPLEVMLTTMRDLWRDAQEAGPDGRDKQIAAVAIAEKVAPYLHPKLSAINHSGDGAPSVTVQIVMPDNGRGDVGTADRAADRVSGKPG